MGLLTVFALYVQPPMVVRYAIGLGLGIASGAAMIPFSMIKEVNPPEVKGSAAGAMNFLCFGVTGVLSPFIARMLDAGPGRVETLPGFEHGLVTLSFGIAVALVLTFFLRETGEAAIHTKSTPSQPDTSGHEAGVGPTLPFTPEPRTA